MQQSSFNRRLMTYDESEEAFSLIGHEDWDLTLAKFQMLAKVFPSSIFVTVKKETREIVAVATAIPSFPGQYVVGTLVVRSDHRSLGLGKAMLLHLLSNIQPSRALSATLTAVQDTDVFYSKMGFQAIGPTHYVNYSKVDRAKVRKACSEYITEDVIISKYTSDMFQALNTYDKQSRGYDCGLYLSVMTDTSDSFLLATSKSSGEVVGYAAGVDQTSLLVVDGLYANNDGIALRLYSGLLDDYPEIDEIKLQEIKPKCFLSQFGALLPKSHHYIRMAVGATAPVCLSCLYVVCDCDYCE